MTSALFKFPVSSTRLAGITCGVVLLYFVGYGMQVAGWNLVESNGGDAGPFPVFFSHGLLVAMSSIALAAAFLAGFVVGRNSQSR